MPSKIEWTEETWNPVTGCTKVSEGCRHCYAERMAKRLAGRCGYDKDNPFEATVHRDRFRQPLKWRKPRMVFVCSMGDLFHENVPDSFIRAVFQIMSRESQHTFQVLTKRPQRMYDLLLFWANQGNTWREGYTRELPPNIWLGVSCENQETANERIPLLLQIPAAVRFVSCEPLLSEIDLTKIDWPQINLAGIRNYFNALEGGGSKTDTPWKIDWIICGGESGPGARPMHPQWARSLRDQCIKAGVPFFFKQWGGTNKKKAGRLLDGRLWEQYP